MLHISRSSWVLGQGDIPWLPDEAAVRGATVMASGGFREGFGEPTGLTEAVFEGDGLGEFGGRKFKALARGTELRGS